MTRDVTSALDQLHARHQLRVALDQPTTLDRHIPMRGSLLEAGQALRC